PLLSFSEKGDYGSCKTLRKNCSSLGGQKSEKAASPIQDNRIWVAVQSDVDALFSLYSHSGRSVDAYLF
ncbi:unnamed protein product, partial [Linum tenue]